MDEKHNLEKIIKPFVNDYFNTLIIYFKDSYAETTDDVTRPNFKFSSVKIRNAIKLKRQFIFNDIIEVHLNENTDQYFYFFINKKILKKICSLWFWGNPLYIQSVNSILSNDNLKTAKKCNLLLYSSGIIKIYRDKENFCYRQTFVGIESFDSYGILY